MPAGSGFDEGQQRRIERAVSDAEKISGLRYSVYVGGADGDLRPFAEQLHRRLPRPDRAVLLVVDPSVRSLEVVTGADARRGLDDEGCRLAVLSMQSWFAEGDLTGGIEAGLQSLAERAQTMTTIPTEEH